MADSDIQVIIGAQISGLVAGVEEAKRSIESLRAPVDAFASSLSGIAEAVGAAFVVEKIKEFATEMAELGEKTLNAASLLGQSVEGYARLSGAFILLGGSADNSQKTFERLALSVQHVAEGNKTAIAAFHNLGISTAEVTKNGNDLTAMLTLIISRYSELAPNLKNIAVLHEILGRGVDNLAGALRSGGDGWKEALAAAGGYARALSENADQEDDSAMKQHALGLALATLANDGFGVLKPAIDAVVDGLDFLANMLDGAVVAVGKFETEVARSDAFKNFVQGIRDVIDVLGIFGDALQHLLTEANTFGLQLNAIFVGLFEGIKALITGGSVEAAMQSMMSNLNQITKTGTDQMVGYWQDAVNRIDRIIAGVSSPQGIDVGQIAITAKRGTRKLGTEGAGGGKGKGKKEGRSEDDEDFSGGLNAASEERNAAAMRQADASYLAAFKANMLEMVKSKQISLQQALGFDEQYTGQLYAQERAQLQAIIDNNEYSVEDKQRAWNQLLELSARYSAQISEDNEKITAAEEKSAAAIQADFTQSFDQIGSTFESTITGMITHSTTLQSGLKKLWDQILGDFTKMLGDMASQWAASQLMSMGIGTGATGAGGGPPGLSNVLTSALGNLFGGGLSAGEAGAASGFGDAFSAASGAIDLGTIGAGGAAAAGGGGLSSLLAFLPLLAAERGGVVPSAAGGWSVPSFAAGGIPSILHGGEMVLPKDISTGMQGMIRGGGGGSPDVHLHFHGPADAPAIQSWFRKNIQTNSSAFRQMFFNSSLTSRNLSIR